GAAAGDAPAGLGPERARPAHARRGARVDAPGPSRRARAVARRHPPERAGRPLPAQPEPARIRRVAGHRSAAGRERLPRRRPAQRAHRRGGQLRPDPAGGRRGVRGDPGPVRALRSQHARGRGEHHHPSGEERFELVPEISGGSFDRQNYRLRLGGMARPLDYYVSLAYTDEGGWRDGSQARIGRAFAKVGLETGPLDATLSYQYSNDRIKQAGSLPRSVANHDPTANLTAGDF